MCLVLLRQVVDAGNAHDGCQLEGPPYHNLHGKQRIANPCSNAGDNQRQGGDVRVGLVEHRQGLPVSLCHSVLPDGKDKQDGREDEIDQHVGDEHDAEQNDDERQQHQRCVDDGGVAYLFPFETHIEAQEDGFQQPGKIDDESCAHLDEVTLLKDSDQHNNDSEKCNSNGIVEHRPFDLKVLSLPFLRQQYIKEKVADDEREYQDKWNDADENHSSVAPLRVEPFVSLEGLVLHVDGRFDHHNLHGQRSEDEEIVGTAVAEDVFLQQVVTALCKLIEFKDLFTYALVVSVLRLKILQKVLHVAPYRIGIQQAGIAVPLL